MSKDMLRMLSSQLLPSLLIGAWWGWAVYVAELSLSPAAQGLAVASAVFTTALFLPGIFKAAK